MSPLMICGKNDQRYDHKKWSMICYTIHFVSQNIFFEIASFPNMSKGNLWWNPFIIELQSVHWSACNFIKINTIIVIFLTFSICHLVAPGQLYAIIEGTTLLPDINHCVFINFQSKVQWQPSNMIGSVGPAEPLMGFESGSFQFDHNALTHQAISPNVRSRLFFVTSSFVLKN